MQREHNETIFFFVLPSFLRHVLLVRPSTGIRNLSLPTNTQSESKISLTMSRLILDTLLSDSLARYQALYGYLYFHNHNAHHLVSLHLLGATDHQLQQTYDIICKELDPYETSPEKINLSNWRDHLGNGHFCQSYRDFFQEQLTKSGSGWRKRFFELLLDNSQQPMMNSVMCGLAHPLIHIGYALELDSVTVAVEALEMTAVCHNYLSDVFNRLGAPRSPSLTVLRIFKAVRSDVRFPIIGRPGDTNRQPFIEQYHDVVLSHYNQWNMSDDDPPKAIEELFDLTLYIYCATHKANQVEFDFFLLHLLTAVHAIRTTYPHIENQQTIRSLLHQFFYFAIVLYVCQLRPEINEQLINDYLVDLEKLNWQYVIDRTLNTKIIDDAHAVKVVRALRDAEQVYGSKNGLYLKAAVKTVDNLNVDAMWVGGKDNERQLNVSRARIDCE